MIDVSEIGAFLGLDVGKGEHHATAVTPAGKKAFDKRLPNSEPKLREVFAKLKAKHGTVLVVVGQPASIGALPLAVARDMDCPVAYLPGLTMRRIADLYPGEAKTDARDAFIIADAARSVPHTVRAVELADEAVAELEMIVGFDDGLAGEATLISNRLRGLLTPPVAGTCAGAASAAPAVLKLLDQFGSPAQIHKAGHRRLVNLIRPKALRMTERLVEDIFTALDEQTVVVPGTDAAALIVPSLAGLLQAVLDQRKLIAARIEELLEAHPLSKVLTSKPGIGVRTGARILIGVGDASSFPSAAHLAAYAGLAPTTRSSRSSTAANNPPGEETNSSNGPSSSPRSPPWPTRSPRPTTPRRSPKESITPKPSSASPDDEPTCSSPCSARAPTTTHNPPLRVDETHRAPAGQGTASSTDRWPAITSTPKYPPLPRNRATSADQSPSGNGTATTNKLY
ncbi:IS110 family transposase [Streptomyces inhibens]|uniref:IS110 family transposase n=1 Tax=Streptomyces inhibens TaxID=2293571 RepID=UPI0037AB8AC2